MTDPEMLDMSYLASIAADEMTSEDVGTLVSLALGAADDPAEDPDAMFDLQVFVAEVVARDPWNAGHALIDGCKTIRQKDFVIGSFCCVAAARSGKRVTPMVLSDWLLEQAGHPDDFDLSPQGYLAHALKGLMLT
jgi:hypothetical protein